MKDTINSNPLEFEGLRHKKLVQRPAAQLHSITTDDPQAAVKKIMRCADYSVNGLTRHTITNSVTNFVTPAKAGIQREKMDSRLRGNDGMMLSDYNLKEQDGMLG